MFYLIEQESVSALDNITVIDNSLVNVDVETPLPPDIPADVDTAGAATTRNNGSRFSFMEKRREARRLKKLEVTFIISSCPHHATLFKIYDFFNLKLILLYRIYKELICTMFANRSKSSARVVEQRAMRN